MTGIGKTNWDRGEFESKSRISPADRHAISEYYRAAMGLGKSSEEVLEELAKRYNRSARQIQRYISGRERSHDSTARPAVDVHPVIYNHGAILEVWNTGGKATFRAHGRILYNIHHAPESYLMYWEAQGGSVQIPTNGKESILVARQFVKGGPVPLYGLEMYLMRPTTEAFVYTGLWATSSGSPVEASDVLVEVTIEPDPPLTEPFKEVYRIRQPSITTLEFDRERSAKVGVP